MNPKILLLLLAVTLLGCKTENREIKTLKGENFELKIAPNQKAVLVLFPCFPCDIENTKTEAKFLKDIEKEGITTLLLSYNQRLFLSEAEKQEYAKTINAILDNYGVAKENIFIGGFSGGGNVSMLLANYLLETKNTIRPKGIFAVDSPIDAEKLYYNAKADIQRNADPVAVEEAKFLVQMLGEQLGNPETDSSKYHALSPYSSGSTRNIAYLKDIKVRFYCEPDLEWQKTNRNRNYEDTNAYMLDKAHQSLVALGSKKTEFIKTKNRGVRANGEKHPHTWNLVERESLLKWMLE